MPISVTFKGTRRCRPGYINMYIEATSDTDPFLCSSILLSVEEVLNLISLVRSGDKKSISIITIKAYDEDELLCAINQAMHSCQCNYYESEMFVHQFSESQFTRAPSTLSVHREAYKAASSIGFPWSQSLAELCIPTIISKRIEYLKNIGLPITVEHAVDIAHVIGAHNINIDIIKNAILVTLPQEVVYEGKVDNPLISNEYDMVRDLLLDKIPHDSAVDAQGHESFIKCLIWQVASKICRMMYEIRYCPRGHITYSDIFADLQLLHELRTL